MPIADVTPLSSGTNPVLPEPDAHGQAALLLVESLIHGLVARSALTVAEAVAIVGIAAEVKIEVAEQEHERAAVMARSLALLEAIGNSLGHDDAG